MGLAELLLGKAHPFTQWAGENKNFLGAIGAGLGQGQNLQSGLSAGLSMVPQADALDYKAAEKQKADAKVEAQLNASTTWLRGVYPDLADMVDAGMPMSEAWNAAMDRQQQAGGYEVGGGDGLPAAVREYEYYSKLSPEDQVKYKLLKRANSWLDAGTEYFMPDPNNPDKPLAVVDKNTELEANLKARGAKIGADEGDSQNDLLDFESSMPGLTSLVDDLISLSDEATYTIAGQVGDEVGKQFGLEPGPGAIARAKYQSTINNYLLPLLKRTFGTQFTEEDREALEATLGDVNMSPGEKKAALNSFLKAKYAELETAKRRVEGPDGSAATVEGSDGSAATMSDAPVFVETRIINGAIYGRDAAGNWYEQ